jgi:hypothetical protein
MKNLHQSTRDHKIVYADRWSKNNFNKTIFVKTQKYERGGRLEAETYIFLMEESHEPFHLD